MRTDTIDPGRMTARMELERPVDTPDGQGGISRAFVSAGALWTLIEPRVALITERAGEKIEHLEHDVWIRHRTDVSVGMRFRKGARLLAILSAFDPDESRRYLVCRCRETLR
ncbi:phage head closure protein [Rhizobium sp. 9140]|uniref:phage head closure protein n=1 Tax=Rhizobium sp. 9140 TaxID=1761900 RepID=UPI00079ACAB9|nr:phage head closure protein [Rhizobium sp. 9140]CZT34563.1 phage head-tail adaptor, putative, SPP1 family [Rhizobium sp. 9140]